MLTALYERLPIPLQNLACGLGGWRIQRQRFNRHFFRTLAWLEQSDHWPLSRLREYQDEQLRRIVEHCYDFVPYYRRQFQKLGIRPAAIRTSDDLACLPILTKEMVRQNPEDFLSSAFPRKTLKKLSTSGTTGAGMAFYYIPNSLTFQAAVWWRFRRRFGLELCHRHAHFGGRRLVPFAQQCPPFWRTNFGLNQVYFSSFHLSPENLPHYAAHLTNEGYRYYSGYPSSLAVVAEYMLQENLKLKTPPLVITTGSETLLPSQRVAIEQAFKCRVADHYGAAELVCSLSQCAHGNYHEDMELGILERVPVEKHSDGQSSRIIGTGLVNFAMPLLRYDMDDIATFTDALCPCGRQAPIAKCIDGRLESYIVTPDGRKIGRLARVFADLPRVRESQIIQTARDTLLVRVVRRNLYDGGDEKDYRLKLTEMVGDDLNIRFEYVEEIPRNKNGKFRAVISKI